MNRLVVGLGEPHGTRRVSGVHNRSAKNGLSLQ